jgi:hypothetical protein
MTQDECLASPHHFTYLGVCYPGSVAYVQLSSANDPKPASFSTNGATSVPEPSTAVLFALALVLGVLSSRIRPRGGAKLG